MWPISQMHSPIFVCDVEGNSLARFKKAIVGRQNKRYVLHYPTVEGELQGHRSEQGPTD